MVYLPVERVLFGGDLLYKERIPWFGDAYISDWVETLDRVRNFDAGIYVPGHGGTRDITMLTQLQSYLMDLQIEVKRYLKGKALMR